MTRSSSNWMQKPGNFDALNTSLLFEGSGPLDIPRLRHTPLVYTPEELVAFRDKVTPAPDRQAVHFFADDYRFESVWHRREQALKYLTPYGMLLTPDFSLYMDYPLAVQIWNVYRSRWCGAYWQSLGFQVIPSISWSTPASYQFCFAGLPLRSLVAVSTLGVRRDDTALFAQGYRELVARLKPSRVLCYGKRLPADIEGLAEVCYYVPKTDRVRNRV